MDCYTATKWAYDNASAIGADPKHVAVGGDSAGGSMAAAVCLLAQDMNGPKLTLQVLMYPMTQPTALYGELLTISSIIPVIVISPASFAVWGLPQFMFATADVSQDTECSSAQHKQASPLCPGSMLYQSINQYI